VYDECVTVDSTLRDVRRAQDGPGARWGRRAGLVILLVIVVLGAVGVFGVHSRTISARSGGYALTVTYPQVARAGLDVPFRVRVHHPGGFSNSLTIAISSDYFRMFETQGFYPTADSMTNTGRLVTFTFTKPPSETFELEYDAYIQPAAQLGKSATIEVLVHGVAVASTTLHTWLVP
jgi:hypothetical protein